MSLKILAQNVFLGETYRASEGFCKSDLEVFSIETGIGERENRWLPYGNELHPPYRSVW